MKIVAMLSVYNNEDILSEVIEHLISEGLELVVLDNGSTDRSFEICEKFLGKGLLKLNRFKSSKFEWATILRILYDMALSQSPDWVVRSDSDEFLESGVNNLKLKEAIIQADAEGYNLIQFDFFNFYLTDNDNESAKSVRKKLTYYSWTHNYAYRAWKFVPGVAVENNGGHFPVFPEATNYKIFDRKFVLRHYRFRSKEQLNKNFSDKIERIKNSTELKMGWHVHNLEFEKYNFLKTLDHNLLTKYEEDNNWNFELKFHPYHNIFLPKREDLFSDDGSLKQETASWSQVRLALQSERHQKSKLQESLEKLQLENQKNLEKVIELQEELAEFKKIASDKK